MKILHSRQICAKQTDRLTEGQTDTHTDKVTYLAPVGAKNKILYS